MIAVAVNGAAGRMGRALVLAVHAHPQIVLAGAVERAKHASLGADAGELAGVGALGIALTDQLDAALKDAQVLIDFTAPAATLVAIERCVALGRAMVIGTTGFDAEGLSAVRRAGEHIAIVMSPNMSVGVNVLFKLVDMAARALGDSADVEVTEVHHRHKVDAPSGTAVRLGEILAGALGRQLSEHGVYGRHGQVGARTTKEIGFHSLRGGDIVGDHTVMFAGEGERIEITHRASSRSNFAEGAMRAAAWLPGRPAGLYGLQDVLGLAS